MARRERLPYLLSMLKAPRVLERLEQTAERARAEQWPYEQCCATNADLRLSCTGSA
jgi:hypothetical protein